MDKIINIIKEYKKNVSPSSLKIYAGNINRIYKFIMDDKKEDKQFDKSFINNKKKIVEYIEAKKALQSRKLYYATLAIVGPGFGMSADDFKYYRGRMMDLKEEFDKNKLEQKKSTKQSENWIDYKTLYGAYKHYKKLITMRKIRKKKELSNNDYNILTNFILLSLFLSDPKNNPPRRASDYADMIIEKYDDPDFIKKTFHDKDIKNFIIKPKHGFNKSNKFIFNKYKTSKTYGQQTVPIGRLLNNDLNLWFKFNKSKKYLLHYPNNPDVPMGSNILTKKLLMIFNDLYNKNISVNMIRSITLTHVYKDMPAVKNLDELASKMGHSVNTAIKTYVKKD